MPSAAKLKWVPAALVFLYMASVFGFLQSRPGGLTERDGYFHARLAQKLPERGLSRRFPWTQASTWKDRFWDKELLYHALMAPFARGEEPVRGARVFAVLLSSAVFLAFYLFLRESGVRGALIFTLVLAGMGGPFLLRLSFIRPHVLSVLIFVTGLHALVRKNWKALGALGFLSAWSYSFPFVLPALAVPFAAGRWLGEDKGRASALDWRCPAAALAGALLGLIIHPYTPISLETVATYFEVLRLALLERALAPVEVGREFAPYSTRSFLLAYPLMTAAVLGLGLAGWGTRKKLSPESLGLLAAASCAFVTTMVFARFVEYAAPLTAAAAAFAVRDALSGQGYSRLRTWTGRRIGASWLLAFTLLAGLGAAHARSFAYALDMRRGNDPPRFRGASRWMAANLGPGELVANLWWDDFPDLFYDGHRQTYLVGLDPAYMLRHDRDKAVMLERMRTGRIPLDPARLVAAFGARYLILRTPNTRFYPQLISGFWKPVYHDNGGAIFALTGPLGPSPAVTGGLPRIPPLAPD